MGERARKLGLICGPTLDKFERMKLHSPRAIELADIKMVSGLEIKIKMDVLSNKHRDDS